MSGDSDLHVIRKGNGDIVVRRPRQHDAVDAGFARLDRAFKMPCHQRGEPAGVGPRTPPERGVRALGVEVGIILQLVVPAADAVGKIRRRAPVVRQDLAHDRLPVGVVNLEKDLAGTVGEDVEVPHIEPDVEFPVLRVQRINRNALAEPERAGAWFRRRALSQEQGDGDGRDNTILTPKRVESTDGSASHPYQ